MSDGFILGDRVFKQTTEAGYGGPGRVVAMFDNEDGQLRYVVGHRIEAGWGEFYHIYSGAQLVRRPLPNVAERPRAEA